MENVSRRRAPTIIGYQAMNNVSVRQRELKDFGKVIDTLAAAGANQINGPMLQMDKPDPALDEARLDAVKAARARAELYANATGSGSCGFSRSPKAAATTARHR